MKEISFSFPFPSWFQPEQAQLPSSLSLFYFFPAAQRLVSWAYPISFPHGPGRHFGPSSPGLAQPS